MAKSAKTVPPRQADDKKNGAAPVKGVSAIATNSLKSPAPKRTKVAPDPELELSVPVEETEPDAKPNRRASKTSLTELNPTLVHLGQTVRKYRKTRNLTQLQLAQRCGFNAAAIFMVEAGRQNMTIKGLMTIAAALGLEVGDLFPRTTPRTSAKLTEVADSMSDVKARLTTQLQMLDRLAQELREEAGVSDPL